MREIISYIIKHNMFVQFLYRYIMSLVFRIVGLFTGFDDRQILFSSTSGEEYTGSPKVLFERMKEDPEFNGYHYVWAFTDPEAYEICGASKVKIDTLKYFICALRSKIWITDANIERGLKFKKKETIFLNTWHGTGPKKSGNALANRRDYDFSNVDIMCVDGSFVGDLFEQSFKADRKSFLYCGRPREDELYTLTEKDKEQIRNELQIPPNIKTVLYMPTWREKERIEPDWGTWEKQLGDGYVVLVRPHHLTKKNNLMTIPDGSFCIDVSDYYSINRLYFVADVLVSDYSSAIFDYGLLKKPMICFAYDYERYLQRPGLRIDLKSEFPGGVQCSDQEVIDAILNMNYEKASEACSNFTMKYVSRHENAAEICLGRIKELLKKTVGENESGL